MKKFEILFVRHALSCANVWQRKGILKAHLRYQDPEITTEGIRKSIEVGQKILYPFKTAQQEPFTIGASVMLRAQQTAYLMFAKRMKKPIFVLPYIGEGFATLDNMPAFLETQRKRYQANKAYQDNPSMYSLLVEHPNANDFRTQEGSWNLMLPISDFSNFLDWISKDENLEYFAEGSDGIYRAILVTHSGFMKRSVPMKGVEKYNNNDGVLVRIQVGEGKPIVEPFDYLPAGESSVDYGICPDTACRYPPPCKTRGGKRKNKKRHQTRRRRA
jgi:hypothetical protein